MSRRLKRTSRALFTSRQSVSLRWRTIHEGYPVQADSLGFITVVDYGPCSACLASTLTCNYHGGLHSTFSVISTEPGCASTAGSTV
jgi:hypothetical protein